MLAEAAHRGELLGQHVDRPVDADGQHVVVAVKRGEDRSHLHVGAEPADARLHRFAALGMDADDARQRQQPQGLLQRDAVALHPLGQGGAPHLDLLVLGVGFALLQIQPPRAAPHGDLLVAVRVHPERALAVLQRFAAVGLAVHHEAAGVLAGRVVRAADEGAVLAELQAEAAGAASGAAARVGAVGGLGEEVRPEIGVQRVDHVGDLEVAGRGDRAAELLPELGHHVAPVGAAVGDVVEPLLQPGGELGVDVALEEAGQEGGDQPAAILGDEAPVLQPHVVAVAQHGENRGVGGGAADADLLHLLDQARLGEARRRLGEMLLGLDRPARQRIALAHRRQHAAVVLRLATRLGILAPVVAALGIEPEEAVEGDDRAGGTQPCGSARLGDLHAHLVEFGRLHLAGHGALPHQLVQPPLLVRQVASHVLGSARDVGRANRLVRLLRVLGLGGILAGGGGQVVGAEAVADVAADLVHRLGRHLHPVGAHVGDQAGGLATELDALVELLRRAHGRLRAHAELAAGLLLQRRGGEGGRRVALDLAPLHRGDGKLAGLHRGLGGQRQRLVVQVELLQLAAVQVGQPCRERRSRRRREVGEHGPVLARLEALDLRFALADQAQRHRLHAPGRAAARQLAPQHRRQGEADQVVERASRQVGLDQRLVECPRPTHRGTYGTLGDLVEGDALHVDAAQQVALLQHRPHVPGDRLALAVRVGREVEPLGAAQGAGDRGDLPVAALVGLPVHREALLGPHAAVLGRQVADVAERCQHRVAVAQVLVDGLRLRRRFDHDDVGHCVSGKCNPRSGAYA